MNEEIISLYKRAIIIANAQEANYQQALSGIVCNLVSMAIYLSRNKVFNESDIASKINLAKEMLTHTNKTIKEIALELGFENNDYFFTVFRRTAGVTPVNYRKITQGGIFSEDIK